MFYSVSILSKKTALGEVWMAGTSETQKIPRRVIREMDIGKKCKTILNPPVTLSLRVSSHLMFGVTRCYHAQVSQFSSDCNNVLVKVRLAFRPGLVDLPEKSQKDNVSVEVTKSDIMRALLGVQDDFVPPLDDGLELANYVLPQEDIVMTQDDVIIPEEDHLPMADPNMSANLSLAEDIAFDDVRPVDDMPDFNNTILPEMDIVPFEESIEFPQIAAPIDDIPPMDLPEDLPPMDIEELPMDDAPLDEIPPMQDLEALMEPRDIDLPPLSPIRETNSNQTGSGPKPATPATKPKVERIKKRKNVLIVDKETKISAEQMKTNLSDTSDIVTMRPQKRRKEMKTLLNDTFHDPMYKYAPEIMDIWRRVHFVPDRSVETRIPAPGELERIGLTEEDLFCVSGAPSLPLPNQDVFNKPSFSDFDPALLPEPEFDFVPEDIEINRDHVPMSPVHENLAPRFDETPLPAAADNEVENVRGLDAIFTPVTPAEQQFFQRSKVLSTPAGLSSVGPYHDVSVSQLKNLTPQTAVGRRYSFEDLSELAEDEINVEIPTQGTDLLVTSEKDSTPDPESSIDIYASRILHLIRNTMEEEKKDSVVFDRIISGASRMSAARAFYRILALQTNSNISVEQKELYGPISISRGPHFE
eukprot:TRINITY_DN2029_c0_g1_i1.p1 TRINITY_DN2029_c0_g1~~TRINITY_DN2029_c0_g1_i1.p1  ORF type:complete len:654 (+),score=182.48 TRINITY_DN2029_c0_g1_i1:38-1963(+)